MTLKTKISAVSVVLLSLTLLGSCKRANVFEPVKDHLIPITLEVLQGEWECIDTWQAVSCAPLSGEYRYRCLITSGCDCLRIHNFRDFGLDISISTFLDSPTNQIHIPEQLIHAKGEKWKIKEGRGIASMNRISLTYYMKNWQYDIHGNLELVRKPTNQKKAYVNIRTSLTRKIL